MEDQLDATFRKNESVCEQSGERKKHLDQLLNTLLTT